MKFTLSSLILVVFFFTASAISALAVPNTKRDHSASSVSFKGLKNKGAFNEGRHSKAVFLEEKRQDGAPGNDDPFAFQCEPGVIGCRATKRSLTSGTLEIADTISALSAEEKRQDGAPGNNDWSIFLCEPGVISCRAEKRSLAPESLDISDISMSAAVEEKRQDGAPGDDDPFAFQCEPGVIGCNDAGADDTTFVDSSLRLGGGWWMVTETGESDDLRYLSSIYSNLTDTMIVMLEMAEKFA